MLNAKKFLLFVSHHLLGLQFVKYISVFAINVITNNCLVSLTFQQITNACKSDCYTFKYLRKTTPVSKIAAGDINDFSWLISAKNFGCPPKI